MISSFPVVFEFVASCSLVIADAIVVFFKLISVVIFVVIFDPPTPHACGFLLLSEQALVQQLPFARYSFLPTSRGPGLYQSCKEAAMGDSPHLLEKFSPLPSLAFLSHTLVSPMFACFNFVPASLSLCLSYTHACHAYTPT